MSLRNTRGGSVAARPDKSLSREVTFDRDISKHGLVFDTAEQSALDQTMDKIKRRYGDDIAMRALALQRKRK